jgi:hypothetical protein
MRARSLLVLLAAACACNAASSEVLPEAPAAALDGALDAAAAAEPAPSAAPSAADLADASADAAGARKQRIIDHSAWTTYDPAQDPLRSHAPAIVRCEPPAYRADPFGQELDVETGTCNYTLLQHPARLAVAKGTPLNARLWYYDLSAPEPAEAHVAIFIDDTLAWETHIPIPSTANVIDADFPAPIDIVLDTPIRFHLHNHGQNSWVFSAFVALLP